MKKINTELKYAALNCLMSTLWVICEYLAGLHTTRKHLHESITWLAVIPVFLVYFFAIREKRKKSGGFISFKQAALSGVIVTLISLILNPVVMPLYFFVINPAFFVDFRDFAISQGMNSAQAADYFTYSNYLMQGEVGALISGVMFVLICAAILQRKDRSKP